MALKTRWRRLLTALFILLVAALLFVVIVVVDGWVAFGKAATGARAAQMRLSPQWQDDHFANPQPMWNDMSLKALFQPSPVMTPTHPPATVVLDKAL